MPSPSLLLGSCSALLSVFSFLSTPVSAATQAYVLQKEYAGSTFFDDWDFIEAGRSADPNHGFVRYRNRNDATQAGLVETINGDAFMRVDSSELLDPGLDTGRNSVKIVTKQSFYHGLIIADIKHMPYGCGTWPAFWALGAAGNWPNSGEIDIIEGVNNRQNSLGVLHTGGQCKIAGDSRTMTGTLQNNDCFYDVRTGAGAVGCAILDDDTRSYGAGLNAAGGSVFAMDWTSDAIKIWSFPSGSVPSDIRSGQPDPSRWGLPAQTFNGPDCNIDDVIKPQKLIFNTNFCGDFGEAVWESEGCAAQTGNPSCTDWVAKNASAFRDAYWQIGFLRYYQLVAAAETTTAVTDSAQPPTTIATTNTVVTVTEVTPTVILTQSSDSAANTIGPILTSPSGSITNTLGPILTSTQNSVTTTTTERFLTDISPIISTPIVTNVVSPTLVSTTRLSSGWEHWVEPTSLTSAIPAGQFYLPPLGSGVPITAGWDRTRPGQQPGVWQPATIGGSLPVTGIRAEWSDSGKARITTLTKSWIEPCETGYTTRTIHIVTTHCGCTETPVPTVPMKIITTTCPEQWGFKTPVVVTVPDTYDRTWAELPAKPTGKDKDNKAETWSVWVSTEKVPAGEPATWNEWSVYKPVAPSTAGTEWSTYKPAASTPQQPTWSGLTPTAATPTPTQGWAGWQGSSNPRIAKWEGAASRTSIGAGVLGLAVAVVAFVV